MRSEFNGGQWSQARFNSFIKSALRSASQRWPPRYATIADAKLGKRINPASGRLAEFYRCNSCKNSFTLKDVEVNHTTPVIPVTGFDSWDAVIGRMFCEKDGLELLCKPCHKALTKLENQQRKENNDKRK